MAETTEKINNDVRIYQNDGSLAFGTDAYLLSAFIKRGPKRVCELGAGSGVITLLCMARRKFERAVCVEVQEKIALLCEKNVHENGFDGKIDVISSDMRDLPADMNGTFDAVLTNPPYMKLTSGKLSENVEDIACRHEVYGTIGDFCKTAARLLKFGGLFYAVYRPDRLSELITACENNDLRVKVLTLVYPTADHEPSAVLLRAKKGAYHGMRTTKPMIIYKSQEDMTDAGFTDDMKYIYENGDANDFFR